MTAAEFKFKATIAIGVFKDRHGVPPTLITVYDFIEDLKIHPRELKIAGIPTTIRAERSHRLVDSIELTTGGRGSPTHLMKF